VPAVRGTTGPATPFVTVSVTGFDTTLLTGIVTPVVTPLLTLSDTALVTSFVTATVTAILTQSETATVTTSVTPTITGLVTCSDTVSVTVPITETVTGFVTMPVTASVTPTDPMPLAAIVLQTPGRARPAPGTASAPAAAMALAPAPAVELPGEESGRLWVKLLGKRPPDASFVTNAASGRPARRQSGMAKPPSQPGQALRPPRPVFCVLYSVFCLPSSRYRITTAFFTSLNPGVSRR